MMNQGLSLEKRVDSFYKLGQYIDEFLRYTENERLNDFSILNNAVSDSAINNPWFTSSDIRRAMHAWSKVLSMESLLDWVSMYPALDKNYTSRNVAVIMAGNIPLVGMHDFIATLLCGQHFLGKLSKNDRFLLPAIAGILIGIEPGFEEMIQFTQDNLKDYDAVIATGSNNTSRYFEFYFSRVPHIIRTSRNGIGILDGKETPEELLSLGDDICQYFGLGCRSISKLYIPEDYDILKILNGCNPHFDEYVNHNKYMNNYLYQKTIHQMNFIPFYDNGAVLMVQNEAIASPISVVFYEYYNDYKSLTEHLSKKSEQIQCMVGSERLQGLIRFGKAQQPELWEYADGIDTIQFLLSLAD
jgi:hypothetical protein